MVNEWTRADLPAAPEAVTAYLRGRGPSAETSDMLSLPGIHAILDAVVEHLNRHSPKVPPVLVMPDLERPESDVDRLRRAHEIVEAERDQAREQWKKWEYKADVWKARAEAAEARTAPAVTRKLVYDAVGAVYDVNGRRGPWPGVEPITDAVCHLFGIETAPDPVETLAVQIEDATRRAVRQACETLAPVAAGLNPEVIEEMMDITEASRRLARHVLGKEARDGVDR